MNGPQKIQMESKSVQNVNQLIGIPQEKRSRRKKKKKCSKCKRRLYTAYFCKDSNKKDNLTCRCKDCLKEYHQLNKKKINAQSKEYWHKNKDTLNKRRKGYYQLNKKKINAQSKEYYQLNKDTLNKKGREYWHAHKEERKEKDNLSHRIYYQANKEKYKIRHKLYKESEKGKEQVARWRKNPKNKLLVRIGNGIRQSLKKKTNVSDKKGTHWEKAVGYTVFKLISHLETQFKEGMSWENYGDWHIDHIIPVSFFKYKTIDDLSFKRCWALRNLQPLWKEENLKKQNFIMEEHLSKYFLNKRRKNIKRVL